MRSSSGVGSGLQYAAEHVVEAVRAAAGGDDLAVGRILGVLHGRGDRARRLLQRLRRCLDEGEREAARARREAQLVVHRRDVVPGDDLAHRRALARGGWVDGEDDLGERAADVQAELVLQRLPQLQRFAQRLQLAAAAANAPGPRDRSCERDERTHGAAGRQSTLRQSALPRHLATEARSRSTGELEADTVLTQRGTCTAK